MIFFKLDFTTSSKHLLKINPKEQNPKTPILILIKRIRFCQGLFFCSSVFPTIRIKMEIKLFPLKNP